MEQVDQPEQNVENQSQPVELDKPSSNWLKFEEVKNAVAHASIDVFDTTAEKVQDVVFELFGHRGSSATVLKHIGKLRKDAAPKIIGEVAPISMPKELQAAFNSSHTALWDIAINVARVTYLHKIEKQNNDLENAKRNEEALIKERDTAAEKADSLSNILQEDRVKSYAQLAAVDQAVRNLNEQMQSDDKRKSEIIEAHKKELDEALSSLEAANQENTHIRARAEQEIKFVKRDADQLVERLENMIERAGQRDSDLRILLKEANNRADAATSRADEYAKKFADLLSNAKPPTQN